jgi:hypothetical protein
LAVLGYVSSFKITKSWVAERCSWNDESSTGGPLSCRRIGEERLTNWPSWAMCLPLRSQSLGLRRGAPGTMSRLQEVSYVFVSGHWGDFARECDD